MRAAVINEGITLHRVIYYLALLVEGQGTLVVAFPVRGKSWIDWDHVMVATHAMLSAVCHCRADPITHIRQHLQPWLEELLPVYESLKPVIDAAKADREACEAFQRREGVIE